MRRMFLLEGVVIGTAGSLLGWVFGFARLCAVAGPLRDQHHRPGADASADRLELPALPDRSGLRAGLGCGRRLPAGAEGGAAQPGRHHPGGDVTR